MATLVLTAVGTAIGGPLGGALGSLVGSRIDGALFAPADREGSRLRELAVTTSSYGSPVPRHFGTMRASGTIIWATDLVESSEETGGGKGRGSTTTYSYSISFAVALASRPIRAVRRIWADGNLLRGTAGDLKVAGTLRVYEGRRDQPVDPLIASAEGISCPAFRGLAYCVFEDLQLAEFGNRIPALTFEIVADDGDVSLAQMIAPAAPVAAVHRDLTALIGYSDEGGPVLGLLSSVDRLYPIACDAGGETLAISDGAPEGGPVAALPPPVVDTTGDAFGRTQGRSIQLRADSRSVPEGLRYYDIARDYQPGLQRAGGRARSGGQRLIEFPGALRASDAQRLADDAAQRADTAQERLSWRIAELDPALTPGAIVAVPDRPGRWRIEGWGWRETGVELDLRRLPWHRAKARAVDAGQALAPPDLVATPTLLQAYELP
ncbi:phage tail protein [Aurantiacibacter spongiae]|nr:phage tail protein [Aurantiacibacter spongiae]